MSVNALPATPAPIVVQGKEAPPATTATSAVLRPDALVTVDPGSARSALVQPGVRGADSATVALGNWPDDALVEVQLDQNVRVWMSVKELRESQRFNQASSQAVVKVGPALSGRSVDRGIGDWVIKALTVFDKPAAQFAHAELVEKIEQRLGGEPGLYRIGSDPQNGLTPFAAPAAAPATPYLVFLHGTASSTVGSFGGLWQANGGTAISTLKQRYQADQILALQHRTLTVSPIDNALVIANALPAGSVLHLVSHSRGGLVGELLARANASAGGAPFSDDERAHFQQAIDALPDEDRAAWNGAAAKLTALNDLLATKHFRVERFARVACPALGTTLASGKLQKWCNIVMNVLGSVSALAGVTMGAAIADLLKGLIAGLITFEDLPGLQAMDPRGPLVRMLNSGEVRTTADLAIIGGITDGDGVWGRLKMLLVDSFFEGANDLVVDTPSMSGGTPRDRGAMRYLLESADINHFQYFDNPVTARHLLDALAGGDLAGKGFESITVSQKLRGAGVAARGAAPAQVKNPPVVFVLPGIMGSDLAIGDDLIWVDKLDLLVHGLDQMQVDTANIRPTALDEDTYSGLVEFLGATHEVIPFPYDWRLALEDAGKALNDALRKKLATIDQAQQPIRIVAHSMGGLVVRAMMLREDSVWPDVCKNEGARVLMLGTPNRGSHAITHLLLGQEDVLKKLAIVHDMGGLLGIIDKYRGALDMMPWPNDRDYFDADVWQQLVPLANPKTKWPQPAAGDLAASHAFCARLALQQFDGKRVFYVAGRAPETPISITVDTSVTPNRLKFMVTAAGDGRVPWDTGIPAGVAAWYVESVHGDIPAFRTAYQGYLDILQTGTTRALSKDRPALARGANDVFEMRERPVSYLPDEDSIRRAGIGRASVAESAPPRGPKVPVRVSWGDLQYASHTVMVGHYAGDTIVSAEAALDANLGGELRRRHQLGIYPGAIGTSLAIDRDPASKPRGAIVIGLGDVGALSAGDVTRAVTHGLLSGLAERTRNTDSLEATGLSLLMIGSNGAGLSISASLNAILRGVTLAYERAKDVVKGAMLTEIEFIELFEDRAHSIWHELGDLIDTTDLANTFVRNGALKRLPNARRRTRMDDAPDWWQRVQITSDGDKLVFNDMVARARAEKSVLPTQRALIDRLLLDATQSATRDVDLERTLFELLIPNDLKNAAPRRDNLLFVLDETTARYPWELLTDSQDTSRLPQSVAAGGMRQLLIREFRQNPAMVTDNSALVIGDPLGPFKELPGAQAEARTVAEQLTRASFKVTLLNDRPKARDVVGALYATTYKALHLAGHGVSDIRTLDGTKKPTPTNGCPGDADDAPISGMLLDDGAFLTFAEIEQMRYVPEFVFINCCHLGRIDDDSGRKPFADGVRRTDMAAQFGAKFISIGVRAVVAAGWAVDDAAAELFAGQLYALMLKGTPFGEAVKRARKLCFDNFPGVNTWGAYQCYGDPDYRLFGRRDAFADTSTATAFASEDELIIEGIERAMSRYSRGQNESAIAAQLDGLRDAAIEQGFVGSGRVFEALGRAYERIGEYARAIANYNDAICADSLMASAATLGAVERRCNLRTRSAIEGLGDAIWGMTSTGVSPADAANAAKEIVQAIADAKALLAFGATRERQVTLAGSHKRLALVVADADRDTALKDMAAAYLAAAACTGNGTDPYPTIQAAVAYILLEKASGTDVPAATSGGARKDKSTQKRPAQTKDEAMTEALLAAAEALLNLHAAAGERSVWTEAMQADLALARAVRANALAEQDAKAILAVYLRALAKARDAGARKSVRENVGFLHALLKGTGRDDLADVLAGLQSIFTAL